MNTRSSYYFNRANAWLLFALIVLILSVCFPAARGQGSMSRFPTATSAAGSKYVYIWSTGTDEKITLDDFMKSRTFVTPILGAATVTSVNKVAITAPASSATLTIANGKTLTASNTLTFTGTDGSSVAVGAGGTMATLAGTQTFTGTKTFDAAVLVAATASGSSAINLSGSSGTFQTPTGVATFNGSVNNFVNAAVPNTSDGAALGSASKMWADVFVASGGVLNFNNGDVTVTHSADILTVAGGDLRVTTVGTNAASAVTVGGTQTLTNKTFVAPALGAATATTINGVTITGAGTLNLASGSSIITSGAYAATLTLTGTTALTAPVAGRLVSVAAEARTVTVAGATTGTISAGSSLVTVTSDDANKILILPVPVAGHRIVIQAPATGFELRSNDPATIAINGGSGSAAESAIPANSTVFITCISATSWKGFIVSSAGVVTTLEPAAP